MMRKEMNERLQQMEIPFFVVSEAEFKGNKEDFLKIREKVVELLDDLTS